MYLVIAQTDVSKGSKGINAFIVEKNWPGVVVGANKINWVLEAAIRIPFYSTM